MTEITFSLHVSILAGRFFLIPDAQIRLSSRNTLQAFTGLYYFPELKTETPKGRKQNLLPFGVS